MTYFPKKIKFVITIFTLILMTFSFVSITEAQIPDDIISEGVKDVIFTPQIGIGDDFQVGAEIEISGRTFANYIIIIYNWALRALVVLAVTMIMVGGISWMSAAGNAAIITGAKTKITSALIGLIIGISSYTLLSLINPELVQLKDLDEYNLNKEIETSHYTVGATIVVTCGGEAAGQQIATGQGSTGVVQTFYDNDWVYRIETKECYPDLDDCTKKYITLLQEIPALRMDQIKSIEVKMGVDANAMLFCDIKSADEFYVKNMMSNNKWFAMIIDGDVDYAGGFDCDAVDIFGANFGAAIKIRACFGDESRCSDLDYQANSDDLLKGFSVILADQSYGGAFFYYEYIHIYTNINCALPGREDAD